MELEIIGQAGAFLLVIGWAFQTKQTIAQKHSGLSLQFDLLYLAGSVLLTLYAIVLNSMVFAVLNGLAALMSLIGLYFKLTEKAEPAKTQTKASPLKTAKSKRKR